MFFTSEEARTSAAAGLVGMPGRTACSAAKTTTPATAALPDSFINLLFSIRWIGDHLNAVVLRHVERFPALPGIPFLQSGGERVA